MTASYPVFKPATLPDLQNGNVKKSIKRDSAEKELFKIKEKEKSLIV